MRLGALTVAVALTTVVQPHARAQTPMQAQEPEGIRLTGFILGNAGWNLGTVAAIDLPSLAAPGSGDIPDENTMFGTVRQTRIGVSSVFHHEAWRLSGVADIDFFGVTGSDPRGGILETGLRLVHAYAQAEYGPFAVLVGQTEIPIAPVSPDSLAYVSLEPLTLAGNLWNRIPQVRGRYRHGSGLSAELAFLRSFGGTDAPVLGSQVDAGGAGEQAVWAMAEARVGLERRGERGGFAVGVGYHIGGTDLFDPANGAKESHLSQAVAVDLDARFARLTLKGEGFWGENIAGLRSLAAPDARPPGFSPARTAGGWAQLGVILIESNQDLRLHGGFGIEDPKDDDVGVGRPTRNLSAFANVIYRPIPRIGASVQWTVIQTDYKFTAPASGTLNAFNVAVQLLL